MTNSFEIRSGGMLRATTAGKLQGYAAVFLSMSADLGGFTERIMPGAFSKSLSGGEAIRALFEHDNQRLLGNTRSGTLKLSEDHHGLAFELELPDTSYANDVRALVQRGDIAGCSFGFQVEQDDWRSHDGQIERDLITVNLKEITITSNPAYLDTSVALRSMDQWRGKSITTGFVELENYWMQTL